ncbi:Na+/H+ antiporter NhaA [Sphingomonas sp. Leaf25]|uniref:Na+/H+ antiporter NhaA n=1 Tax=Sphingomonas sp. Leaf25 TaxID=1735692 RepID=UPI0006F4EF57|nr:Na+/H+ antiporter NhaA [Sphingomonas sp. Leaf25]KQM97983.1 sodium:proton antiporter [Sphingomonas sp. Leaf25]
MSSPSPSSRPRRATRAIRRFFAGQAAGGLVLLGAAVLALLVANSPAAPAYFAGLEAHVGPLSIRHWIDDGLMTLFFLLIGLEVKRELIAGQLSAWDQRILPGAAAVAGMAVPALLYSAINAGTPALRGWAIPAATDIAFALGIVALLGPRVPLSLKVLLTAIAVIDDLLAIVVIAVFYTESIAVVPLALAIVGLAILLGFNRMGVRSLAPYLLVGAGVWVAVLLSGVHATLAGVAVALTIPLRGAGETPPLERLEHAIQPWVAFAIVPLFGFANAGVSFAGTGPADLIAPLPLGIMAGLFLGKQAGIFATVWAMVRLGLTTMPDHAGWRQVWGMAALCGIGFTMSLFIGGLAFGEGPVMDAVRIGVLGGSLLSGLVGWAILARR